MYHRKENGTTIRGGTADKWVPLWLLSFRNFYAGIAQFGATTALLGAIDSPADAAMLSLIPIQIGAFVNTLTKKHIIGSLGHGVIYGGTLALAYMYFVFNGPMYLVFFCVQFGLRIVGINKYVIMILTCYLIHALDFSQNVINILV